MLSSKEGKRTKRFSVDLPFNLWQDAAIQAVKDNRKLADIIRDLLKDWIARTKRLGNVEKAVRT